MKVSEVHFLSVRVWSDHWVSVDERALNENDPAFALIPLVKSPSQSNPTIMFQVKDCEKWFKKRQTLAAIPLAGRYDVPLERVRKRKEISDEIDLIRKSGPSNRPEIRNKKACNTFFKSVGMPEFVIPDSDTAGGRSDAMSGRPDSTGGGDDEEEDLHSSPPRPSKRRRRF